MAETAAATTTAPATEAEETKKKSPTPQEQMAARETGSRAEIGKIYDTGLNAQKQGLLDAYNANMQTQSSLGQSIRQNYENAMRDVGVQNARNDANVTQFADVRGVNTGLGSQHQLNLSNARARAEGALAYQQQQALAENQRQQEVATQMYQNQVAAAMADNDYKKAAALLDDYNNQQKWRDQQAQILASYGNFEPYKELYGDEAANGMQKIWQAQNPDVAYRTGAISAEQYKAITGKYPAGYNAGGGGGGYGGYGGYIPTGVDDATKARVQNAANNVINTVRAFVGGSGGGSKQTPSLYGVNGASAKK